MLNNLLNMSKKKVRKLRFLNIWNRLKKEKDSLKKNYKDIKEYNNKEWKKNRGIFSS